MKILIFLIMLMPASSYATEGRMCSMGYEAVMRAANNMNANKELSLLAKEAIFEGLRLKMDYCLTDCEGGKFKFCNDFSKYFEIK
jgi:hypothetical protein